MNINETFNFPSCFFNGKKIMNFIDFCLHKKLYKLLLNVFMDTIEHQFNKSFPQEDINNIKNT